MADSGVYRIVSTERANEEEEEMKLLLLKNISESEKKSEGLAFCAAMNVLLAAVDVLIFSIT